MRAARPMFAANKQTWEDMFPGWSLTVWDNDTIRPLLAEVDSDLGLSTLSKYDAAAVKAVQADIARYAIVYKHGGLYVDTDMECLRPFAHMLPTIGDKETAMAMANEVGDVIEQRHAARTNNSLFYEAAPKSGAMRTMLTRIHSMALPKTTSAIFAFAGPKALYDAYIAQGDLVRWLPRDMFEPIREEGMHLYGIRGDAARQTFPYAYTLHNYDFSWVPMKTVLLPVLKTGSSMLGQRSLLVIWAFLVTLIFVPVFIASVTMWRSGRRK